MLSERVLDDGVDIHGLTLTIYRSANCATNHYYAGYWPDIWNFLIQPFSLV